MKKKVAILLTRNIIWATIIFVLCTMPGDRLPDPRLDIPYMDKMVHFGMFFIMALLLCNELEYQTHWRKRRIYMIAVGVVFLYGGVIEIMQEYWFERSGDIWDLLADVFGAIVGCLTYPYLRKLKNRIFAVKSK
ncbi:VanZ family protein [Porphyromonadaceae bacterium OttesenSCG-928-L07]|nr:VanZ family protein [Porphyromonadaceae bacterium OttesenSCG-928-L07]MDL2330746.1 VanZ family protein [Odoribacter sp. OttesenSCG-928-A06]